MLIHLLNACDYLLVVLLLLPGSNQRSLNADHLRPKNETAEEGAKSFSLLKGVENFVDGQCPPNSLKVNGMEGECRHECSSDIDCTEDYRCCEDGCSFKCVEPWFPNRVVDWAKSSALNQISDDPELSSQRNGPWNSRGEPCSTSVLDGLQPLRCPTNYICQITVDGDIQLNIPNRGECVKINDKKTAITENANHPDFLTVDTVCSHTGETYKHKEKFRKDCNICICHNGVVFCDNQPCPDKIGIPAVISNYEEHRQTSRHQYINIDSEDGETEDPPGSSGSGEGGEGREEIRMEENVDDIELSNDDETEVQSGADEEGEQGEEHSTASDGVRTVVVKSDEEDWREVNGEDNDDENSGDDNQAQQREENIGENSDSKVIDLQSQGKFNNQDFSGESGSAELETETPQITESTTRTGEPEIYTFARETSTLIPEISTLAKKTSTLTKKSSTLSPETMATEISTVSPEVDQNEITTTSSRLAKVKPTEDIIRLEGSDYEPSGISLDNYSGDDEEGSSGNSGDYGSCEYSGEEHSTEETQHPEPVYPGTIVLGKYIKGGNRNAEFGFETDNPRNDVVNDGSVNRETEARSGDEGSASQSIVGKSGVRKHKRRGETLEYLKTTDDEH